MTSGGQLNEENSHMLAVQKDSEQAVALDGTLKKKLFPFEPKETPDRVPDVLADVVVAYVSVGIFQVKDAQVHVEIPVNAEQND
jgi:hypothetical protein